MAIYAILNKDTNTVNNIVIADSEDFVFLNSDEYAALANRAVEKGMTYNKKTKSFPEAGDKGEWMDLRDEIISLAENHQKLLSENTHLTQQEFEVHLTYINDLRTASSLETYSEMKSQFDLIESPPEFPPAPKEITQDAFKSVLKLAEKILWDNPETGTEVQKATINTLKLEFPYYGIESMTEEFELLEQVGFFTAQRVDEVKQALS
jgi:hypothetical protein